MHNGRLIEERELDVNISVSIMEIYNEKIKDLLSNVATLPVYPACYDHLTMQDRTVHHEVVSCRNGSMEVTHLTKR